MHIAEAWDLQRRQTSTTNLAGAGVGVPPSEDAPSRRSRERSYSNALCACFYLPFYLLSFDGGGRKAPAWCMIGGLIGCAIYFIGRFEATRLTTHVLKSPCTVVSSEVLDVGTCTLCDASMPAKCEVHPIATARLSVTFKPIHRESNVSGFVWYCKERESVDPCRLQVQFQDQMSLDMQNYGRPSVGFASPVPCTVGEVFSYMERHALEGQHHDCYYSSQDAGGEDVWLSMPSPGLVDHAWFQKHMEYPIFLALGGLVLLSVLLGCLALDGAEVWASGLL